MRWLRDRLHDRRLNCPVLKKSRAAVMDIIEKDRSASLSLLNERAEAEMAIFEEAADARMQVAKDAQAAQLGELKAAQKLELDELKSARNAALSVVEKAIQRELEDERIRARLTIDIRKAGADQEAVDAANKRAQEAFERLGERDEMNALMAQAEARVRARYQDELNTITDALGREGVETENVPRS